MHLARLRRRALTMSASSPRASGADHVSYARLPLRSRARAIPRARTSMRLSDPREMWSSTPVSLQAPVASSDVLRGLFGPFAGDVLTALTGRADGPYLVIARDPRGFEVTTKPWTSEVGEALDAVEQALRQENVLGDL